MREHQLILMPLCIYMLRFLQCMDRQIQALELIFLSIQKPRLQDLRYIHLIVDRNQQVVVQKA